MSSSRLSAQRLPIASIQPMRPVRHETLRTALAALAMMGSVMCLAPRAQAAEAQPDSYVGISLGANVAVPRQVDRGDVTATTARVSPGLYIGTRVGGLPVGSSVWPLSVEFGHQRIAKHTVSYPVGTGRADLTARGHATYAAVKLDAPITERFGLYGKLGLSRNRVDGSTPVGQTAIDIDGSHTGLMSAFGVQYHLTQELSLRSELVSFGKTSPNSRGGGLNAGLAYRF